MATKKTKYNIDDFKDRMTCPVGFVVTTPKDRKQNKIKVKDKQDKGADFEPENNQIEREQLSE